MFVMFALFLELLLSRTLRDIPQASQCWPGSPSPARRQTHPPSCNQPELIAPCYANTRGMLEVSLCHIAPGLLLCWDLPEIQTQVQPPALSSLVSLYLEISSASPWGQCSSGEDWWASRPAQAMPPVASGRTLSQAWKEKSLAHNTAFARNSHDENFWFSTRFSCKEIIVGLEQRMGTRVVINELPISVCWSRALFCPKHQAMKSFYNDQQCSTSREMQAIKDVFPCLVLPLK